MTALQDLVEFDTLGFNTYECPLCHERYPEWAECSCGTLPEYPAICVNISENEVVAPRGNK